MVRVSFFRIFCSCSKQLLCCQISKLKSQKNTYGWARAEVLGALVNSVFLVALCFTIFVEAIQRLTHSNIIEQVDILLYVGVAGLVINVMGLFLFHGHGHSHGGHEHQLADVELEARGIRDNILDRERGQ